MTVEIRPITDDELPQFGRRLATAFGGETSDARIESNRTITELDRTLSAWDGGELVGTAAAFSFDMTVPGGSAIPAAGVTMVSVTPTHRRRGILSEFMRRQLDDVAERGEPVALLTASEGSIYGRFGYGIGTFWAAVSIPIEGTTLVRPSTAGGRVRNLAADDWAKVVQPIYERLLPRYVGEVRRPDGFWTEWAKDHPWQREGRTPLQVVVHEDPAGEPDGFVVWRTKGGWEHSLPRFEVHAEMLYGADDEVETALWQHLMSIDLARLVVAQRPTDEQLRWRLDEHRKLKVSHIGDHLWVRIVDVGAAFSARSYDVDDAVVVGLRDPFRPQNDGTWRIAADGCGRTDAAAELELDVADLGSLYLGGVTASALARSGRVVEKVPGALRRADRLLSTPTQPWCATHF